jgi:hypothetical protein
MEKLAESLGITRLSKSQVSVMARAAAGPGDHGDADWDKAVAALQKVWARLGFEHFRDGVHVLDLSLVTLDENLGQLRKNAERHRAVQD